MLSINVDEVVMGSDVTSQEAEFGLKDILTRMTQDVDLVDLRHAAYMLATVRHECAGRYVPIEEFGKGHGRPYSAVVKLTAGDEIYHNIYYGRGLTQLTWLENYRLMGREIGLGDELMYHPEKALEPANSYAIMSHGMRKGMFTGVGLSRFINGTACDYEHSRKIINGMDCAAKIAVYALEFEKLLRDSTIS